LSPPRVCFPLLSCRPPPSPCACQYFFPLLISAINFRILWSFNPGRLQRALSRFTPQAFYFPPTTPPVLVNMPTRERLPPILVVFLSAILIFFPTRYGLFKPPQCSFSCPQLRSQPGDRALTIIAMLPVYFNLS